MQVIQCGQAKRNEKRPFEEMSRRLANQRDFVMLTNIGGIAQGTREIDAVIIGLGVVVCIELKSWDGLISAHINEEWHTYDSVHGDLPAGSRRPLSQAQNAAYSLKNFVEQKENLKRKFWFSSIVLISNNLARLAYAGNEGDTLKCLVFHIRDLEEGLVRHLNFTNQERLEKKINLAKCASSDIGDLIHKFGINPNRVESYLNSLDRNNFNYSMHHNNKSDKPVSVLSDEISNLGTPKTESNVTSEQRLKSVERIIMRLKYKSNIKDSISNK